ncbi:MAG: restriction endonuclease subunit S [Candidatus Phytoplasma asteris]|uniref:Restriction endonuclease S subunits n=1 Tax='Chrysanthemum coronarium' phytoplasma TaxID=1520703 RepID=A0ABQ0J1R7_9MOLU|nr:MAG: restriction endonuclease subunit S [Periwinkle leaf yellowing phytoplasma]WEX20092.1 MAG: restriction endonuclease subunit S [Candidatus Phytoplasma asteris]GAK73556.1 restriction endonuclease S subunits ['Chrysanthemum coronarium' phytoplasma]
MWGGGIKPKVSYNKSNTPENNITSVGSCGYIHFHTKPFWAAQNLQILKPKDDSFNVLYFYFYLKQKENEIQKNLKQGHIPNFTQKLIKKIKITLTPLETQNEIATFLNKTLKQIEEKTNLLNSLMKDLLNKTDEQKQYLFNKLLF